MEGRRIRVGGAAALTCDAVVVDDPEEPDENEEDSDDSFISIFCSSSFVFLELGLSVFFNISLAFSPSQLPNSKSKPWRSLTQL